MYITKDMRTIQFKVQSILESKPELRDNINDFVLEYWKQFDDLGGALELKCFDFWFNQEATRYETIRRTWQKIQQMNPHLRGKLYNSRHKLGEQTRFTIVEEKDFIDSKHL